MFFSRYSKVWLAENYMRSIPEDSRLRVNQLIIAILTFKKVVLSVDLDDDWLCNEWTPRETYMEGKSVSARWLNTVHALNRMIRAVQKPCFPRLGDRSLSRRLDRTIFQAAIRSDHLR